MELKKRFFAQIADGLEELGAEELEGLGAEKISPVFRGLYFDADYATIYRINYSARLVTRVLLPLISFSCHNPDVLYKKAKTEIRWDDFLTTENTFAIFSNVSNSKIRHSQYAGLRLKDAIADFFREHYRRRPNVNPQDPDVWFNLHIENNKATISLDTSGGSLHRRGYRQESIKAPMQESVAAAMIQLTDWDGSKPLYDPMCGSGTLLCEALMYYCRIPSGLLREKFGVSFLPNFNSVEWEAVKRKTDKQIRQIPEGLISGSDISKEAVLASRKNLNKLPYGKKIKIEQKDFRKIKRLEDSVILCNPPYGIRLEKDENIQALYQSLGDFLKKQCKGSTAFIYFGNRKLLKHIGLKSAWKKPLKSGGLDGRLVKYEMY